MASVIPTSVAIKKAAQSGKTKEERAIEQLRTVSVQDLQLMDYDQFMGTFIRNEDDYLTLVLKALVTIMQRIRAAKFKGIDDKILSKIFINVEAIHDFHSEMLADMKKAAAKGTLVEDFGKLALNFVPFFKLYSLYIGGQKDAMELYRETGAQNIKFGKMMAEYYFQNGVKISTLMEVPVLRLPQYMVYLAIHYNNLSYYSRELVDAQTETGEAVERLQKTLDEIAVQVHDKTSRDLVAHIQTKLLRNTVNLLDPARVALKAGVLYLLDPNSPRQKERHDMYVAVFNDMLVLINMVGSGRSSASIKKIYRMKSMSVKAVRTPDVTAGLMISDASSRAVLDCCSEGNMNAWLLTIQTAIEDQAESKIGDYISDDYFEKMIFGRVEQIPLVDTKKAQSEVAALRAKEAESSFKASPAIASELAAVRKPAPSRAKEPETFKPTSMSSPDLAASWKMSFSGDHLVPKKPPPSRPLLNPAGRTPTNPVLSPPQPASEDLRPKKPGKKPDFVRNIPPPDLTSSSSSSSGWGPAQPPKPPNKPPKPDIVYDQYYEPEEEAVVAQQEEYPAPEADYYEENETKFEEEYEDTAKKPKRPGKKVKFAGLPKVEMRSERLTLANDLTGYLDMYRSRVGTVIDQTEFGQAE